MSTKMQGVYKGLVVRISYVGLLLPFMLGVGGGCGMQRQDQSVDSRWKGHSEPAWFWLTRNV